MGQISVTIDGKAYRMACDDGQEEHLANLAAHLDTKVQSMRQSFGEIGDMRLTVMAAITVADEVSELKRRLQETEAVLAAAQARLAQSGETQDNHDRATADAVTQLAERIERIAKGLAAV